MPRADMKWCACLIAALLLATTAWLAPAAGQVPSAPDETPAVVEAAPSPGVPALDAAVIDTTGTLSATERQGIEARIAGYETRRGSQLQVLIVPSTGSESIEAYAERAFRTWRLGRKDVDDGLLLVIAKDDRTARIEVGYGLEGAIPDIAAGRVLDEDVVPRFREGDYAGGIDASVARLIALAEGEALPPPAASTAGDARIGGAALLAAFFLALCAGACMGRGWLRWPWAVGAAMAGGCLVGLLAGEDAAASIVFAIFPPSLGIPLGWGVAKSRVVRIWAGVALGAILALVLLAQVIGGERVMLGVGIAFGLCIFGAFAAMPIAGAVHAWRHGRTGFWVRIVLLCAGVAFALYQMARGGWDVGVVVPACFLLFVGSVMLFMSALPGGSGGSSGSRSSSSSGSSSGGRSGGGGSSGGGGASRSW